MARPDLNLLVTLDVLLAEGSVAGAARKLKLSPSAMSRALSRLREVTGDPLLVRAGRDLVPTPRAVELRDRVAQVVLDGEAILRPTSRINLEALVRTFTLRTSEGFVENFGPGLVSRVQAEAPGVQLHFALKPNKDSTPLRDGTVDLETGVIESDTSPELRAQSLFHDRLVGVVRKAHPLAKRDVTLADYSAAGHVHVSRRGMHRGLIDQALLPSGLERRVVAIVGGFSAALTLARGSDLIATVPERHSGVLLEGLRVFRLPFETPEITVSLLWHPRMDADPAHRWLRGVVRDVCTSSAPA